MPLSQSGTSLNVKIGRLDLQLFTTSRFHFFIAVESATSEVLPYVACFPHPYQVLQHTKKQND
jgi:hypothetical protein